MNILIMGPAGSGKGTMSDLILKDYDIPHISTGDMLRENIQLKTELGNLAKSYMNAGHLVPDDVINSMVEKRLQEPDCQKGYLLDGYPRTVVQAEKLQEISNRIGRPVESVILLDVGFDALVTRITGRRICPKCGSIYHTTFKPSKVEGICDQCGGELQQRKDDTVEQLKVRMEDYEAITKPVVEYFDKFGVVERVDASKNTQETYLQVKKALGKVAK